MSMASRKFLDSLCSEPFSRQQRRPQPVPTALVLTNSAEIRGWSSPQPLSGPSIQLSWKARHEMSLLHAWPIRLRIGNRSNSSSSSSSRSWGKGKINRQLGCWELQLHVVAEAISSPGFFVGEEEPSSERSLSAEEKRLSTNRKKRLIAGIDQTQLREPHLLAEPDSRFVEYYGVQIHHKIARPKKEAHSKAATPAAASGEPEQKSRAGVPAILLHGFGASLFSWEKVMPKLAEILGAPVLAFDRPAFGLTSRMLPSQSSPPDERVKKKFGSFYSVAYSAAAALAFTDFLKVDQTILIGHSAGCLVAVESYFKSPEKIAAMIFVAPALLAPLVIAQIADAKRPRKPKGKDDGEIKRETPTPAPLAQVWKFLVWTWAKLTSLVTAFRRFLSLAIAKLYALVLRSPPAVWLVRRIMNRGGPFAVRYAFFDATKADKHVLKGYTKPLGCRDWEKALLEYCLALMHKSDDQQARHQKLQDVSCPVLVVTGDTDRIVPAWNSERLARVFPNTEFRSIKNCGHLPHEETPNEFVSTIEDWVARTLTKRTSSVEPAASDP